MSCWGRIFKSTLKPDLQICIVGENLKENQNLMKSLKKFDIPIVFDNTGHKFLNQKRAKCETIFVLGEFKGEVYDTLHKSGRRILGPTCVIQCAEMEESLPNSTRPLFTTSMKNLKVCFTGFREKEELIAMVDQVHHMGGGVRKDLNASKITHLISNSSVTEKHNFAKEHGISIMSAEWVEELWARRYDNYCIATSEEMMQYKFGTSIDFNTAFINYSEDEKEQKMEISSETVYDEEAINTLEFLMLVGKLKHLRRSGWANHGIFNCETVSAHMYRMGIMALFLNKNGNKDLNQNKCIKMALVHDIAKCLAGDYTLFCGVSEKEKHRREMEAMDRICHLAGAQIGKEMHNLFKEYVAQKTKEARAVKDLDRFELILQAYEYEKDTNAPKSLESYFNRTEGTFENPMILKWLEQLKNIRTCRST